MKKILSAVAAIALAASLISCGDSGDSYTSNADTVLSVGTPVVTGKAYPGVNYITWTPVANAKEYEIYRTVGGASEKVDTVSSGVLEFADYAGKNNGSDFALVDGVNYEYTIFAVGANSTNVPSRLVYLATSTAKTTVKATVPAYGTDITAFTDKATKDYLAKIAAKTGVTAPALIDPTTFAKDTYNISLAYPVIPGYKYGVTLVNETKVAAGIEQKKATSFADNFKSTYTAQAYKFAPASGKYTAYLTVAALSPLYPTTAVYALGDLEIKDIGEKSATSSVAATYSADGKNAYVTWTPAKLTATSKETPVANYNVYRASAADNYQTLTKINSDTNKVAALVKESVTTASSGSATVSDVYGITDTIADNTIDYKYYVVHTNGTLYGAYSSANETTLSAFTLTETAAPSIRSITTISTDKENIENTFKVVVRKANEKQTLTLAYVKLADVYTGETIKQTFEPSAFTAVALGNPNYDFSIEENTAYVKVPVGTYLFKLTATETTGKKAKDVYQVAVMTPAGGDVAVGSLRATKLTDADKSLIITDTSINDDTVGLYSYKVVTVETSTVNAYSQNVTTTTTFGDAFALAKVTNDSDAKLKNNVALGTYAALKTYKVATNEAGASTYKTATTYVQKISKSTGKTGNVQAY